MTWKDRQDIGFFWLILICIEAAIIIAVTLGIMGICDLYLFPFSYHCGGGK